MAGKENGFESLIAAILEDQVALSHAAGLCSAVQRSRLSRKRVKKEKGYEQPENYSLLPGGDALYHSRVVSGIKLSPIRYLSQAIAALRPVAIPRTTREAPRRVSPAAKMPSTEVTP